MTAIMTVVPMIEATAGTVIVTGGIAVTGEMTGAGGTIAAGNGAIGVTIAAIMAGMTGAAAIVGANGITAGG